ncbi:MAG: hypothetical protein KDE27_06180 [Planctomycetes bacterium]|nr:hypothetical protein [Planctomycetota bacterium]
MRAAVALLAIAALQLPAQSIHLVGPGALPQIRDALAIASSGDVILVQPGTYAHVEITTGVTIRGLPGGRVDIEFDPAFVPPACAQNIFCAAQQGPSDIDIQPHETVTLVDLNFVGNTALVGGITVSHRLQADRGTVVLDGCSVRCAGTSGLRVADCTLVCRDTEVLAMPGTFLPFALTAADSHVLATNSTFTAALSSTNFGGVGIQLIRSTLQASRVTATGGPFAAALAADTASAIWVSDSSFVSGAPSVCPLAVGGAAGRYDRCTFNTIPAGCTLLPTGFVAGVDQLLPIVRSSVWIAVLTAEPNAPIGVFASFGLAERPEPLVEQPLFAPLPIPFALLLADAFGSATLAWNVPAAVPGHPSVWLHAVTGTGLPLQTTPPIGGAVR